MKKLFNKFFAVTIALALVATMAVGVSFADKAKASSEMAITGLTFSQGGQYNAGEPGNEGYLNSVTMAETGEVLDGWLRGAGSMEQEQSAQEVSNGFTVNIENNGWDAKWKSVTGAPVTTINPWSIQAIVNSDLTPNEDHKFKVSFKAKASKTKDCYVTFATEVGGQEMPPYDTAPLEEGSDSQFIELTTTEKTFTYYFHNYVEGDFLKTTFMLGAFTADDDGNLYDYGQNQITSGIKAEAKYKGIVTISDYVVEDLSQDPTTAGPTTEAPTVEPSTEAPTVEPSTETPSVEPSTEAPSVEPSTETTTAESSTEATTAETSTEATTAAPATSVTPATTVAPQPTTQAPTIKKLGAVTGVKVKSVKKKTIKVSWKKVKNAKTYQIKVGNKTYKSTKTSKKIKNKKFKKGKKVKVKVRATATGYTTGAWSKTVKKKLTK